MLLIISYASTFPVMSVHMKWSICYLLLQISIGWNFVQKKLNSSKGQNFL